MFPKQDFEAEFNEIQKIISKEFKTQLEISSDYFKRLFVYKNDTALKIEFVYEKFSNCKKSDFERKNFFRYKRKYSSQ
jgi:hypothetical protein